MIIPLTTNDVTASTDKNYVTDAQLVVIGNTSGTNTGAYEDLTGKPSAMMGIVIHGATAGTLRPSGYACITWIGSVTPTNAITNDLFINTV